MSTTTSQESASAISTRGDTSSPRLFYVGMAVFMIAVIFVGFWPSYFSALFTGEEASGVDLEQRWITHLHAAIFLGWMALLLTQATLTARGQVKRHMTLGRFGVGLGVAVLLMGIVVLVLRHDQFVSERSLAWVPALIDRWEAWVTLPLFLLLLAFGFLYRTKPEAHKRYMLFATAVLLDAATARMDYLLGAWSKEVMFVAIVGPILAYDLYTQHRLHPASLIGTGIVGIPIILGALLG